MVEIATGRVLQPQVHLVTRWPPGPCELAADQRVPYIATRVERGADRDVLAVPGADGAPGIVTGGEWDASQLAATTVTRPTP